MLDFFPDHVDHHDFTSFGSSSSSSSPTQSTGLSTGAAIGIGAGSVAVAAIGGFYGYHKIFKPMTLRDSSTQIPDFDPTLTPPAGHRSTRPGMHGETGDPSSEFLSATPSGRLKKNSRGRFF